MTADDLKAKLREADEACPCRSVRWGEKALGCFSKRNPGTCPCEDEESRDKRLRCPWPGHAAIRALARAAAEWSLRNYSCCDDYHTADSRKALDALLEGGDDERTDCGFCRIGSDCYQRLVAEAREQARRETWRAAAAFLGTFVGAKGDAAIRRDMAIEEFERRAREGK